MNEAAQCKKRPGKVRASRSRDLDAVPADDRLDHVRPRASDITLIVVRNPFDVSDRVISTVPYSAIETITGYVAQAHGYDPDVEFHAAVNGAVIPQDKWATTTLRPGSYISVVPVVGKSSIMGLILELGLSYVALGAGGLASGQGWGAAMDTWNTFGRMMSMAVMALGGALISHLFPAPKVDSGLNSSSPTYSWSTTQATAGQGGPVPIVYGTVQTAGQILAQHITSDGTDQYLNLLICAGDGPVDAITDITINDNPVANYDNVIVETRLGDNLQQPISFFGDQYSDVSPGFTNLTNDWVQDVVPGNATEGIEITFQCPEGLYYMNDDGSFASASVTVEAQYSSDGGSTWTEWGTWTISAADSASLWRAYRKDTMTAGSYMVRVRCTVASGAGNRYMVRVDWSQVTGIIYDDLCRPGKALVGIRALATDQLSGGNPTVKFNVTRNNVYVWNPGIGGSGSYESQPATNPAWAAWDLVHRAKMLKDPRDGSVQFINYGADADRMIYDEFLAWAKACNNANLTVNLYLDQPSDLWDALKDIEGAGRGKVTQKGSKFGAVCDAPSDPVQLFNTGNIIQGTFTESFLGTRDRATSVEVAFNNSAKNWQRDVVTVYSDDYDTDPTYSNPTQISLNGITTLDQAWREAKYRLWLNQYLLRTIQFEAEVDAIACQAGDVILVQHDVPNWGVGGRVLSATRNGAQDMIKLDKPVTMTANTAYEVMVRISSMDLLAKGQIQVPEQTTTTDTITTMTNLAQLPAAGDIFAFGQTNISTKPFRVVNITRSSDSTRKISAVEYIEAVYAEATDVPEVDYSPPVNVVTNLAVNCHQDAQGLIWLDISWTPPRNIYNGATILINGAKDGSVDGTKITYSTQVQFTNTTYDVAVISTDLFGMPGQQVTQTITVPDLSGPGGQLTPPESLDYFAAAFSGAGIALSWRLSTGTPNCDGYEVRRGSSWAVGQIVAKVPGKDALGTTVPAIVGISTYWVCPYNKAGYAATPISDTILVSAVPSKYQIATATHYEKMTGVVISGSGVASCGQVVQFSTKKYADVKNLTYGTMKTETQAQIGGGAAGPAIITGAVIDIGKVCTFTISPVEDWAKAPDYPTIYSYSTSTDGASYTPYKILTAGQITARYIKVTAAISGEAIPGVLNGLTIQILADLMTQQFINQAIAVGGTTITYSPAFLNKPATLVGANNNAALTPKKIAEDNTSITVALLNAAGTDVGGTADVTAVGF